MRRSTLTAGISMLLVGFLTVSASADTISLDFATGADPAAGGTNAPDTMLPGTSAGVVNVSHWNNLYLANGTLGSLVNSGGANTTASVTWASNGTYATGNPDNTGNYQMMNTEIDERSSGFGGPIPATVTVSGLSGPGAYDVYVYYNAISGPGNVHAAYTIGSTTYYTSNNTFDGTTFTRETNTSPTGSYTAGANYVEFVGVTGSGFTLSDDPETFRGEINGIQIVGVPEPSSWVALCGLGLAGLFVVVRRRRKS